MTVAYVAVGSNIDPERNVPAGLRRLAARVRITGVSTFHLTPPLGAPGTPSFVNGVVRVETALDPRALKFEVLRRVEAETGRVRGGDRNAPRTLDLDLLVHGEAVVEAADLRVPDPEAATRPFLAFPLFELAPDLVLPGSGLDREAVLGRLLPATMAPLADLTRRLREEFTDEP